MLLLEATDIKVHIEDRLLFDIEKLQVHANDRIGLVGRNGSGKTTLLEILAKKRKGDTGSIKVFGRTTLLPQLKNFSSPKSGGEVTQQYIIDALEQNPEVLLADEPTTNLDTAHVEWLEKKLGHWQGAFIIVSHDRAFLNALCTKIWEISEGKIKEYKGNYSYYAEQKELEQRQHDAAYEQYIQKKKQLEKALEQKERKAQRATKTPKKVSKSEAKITGAKPYFAKKQKKLQKAAKAIETRMEKLEKVEKRKVLPPIKMNLPNENHFKGRIIIRIEDVEGKIKDQVLWEPVRFNIRGGDKLAIIGPNGCGKTTFIKKLLRREKGFSISPSVKIGYFSQNLDVLNTEKSILENVMSTSIQEETIVRTILARLHFFREDVHKKVNVLSGGERVKVALAKLFVSNINTLVLDEPTNFLDLEAIEALESLLKEYEGTVIFVSHDREFIDQVAAKIAAFENGKIQFFDGTYEQYKKKTDEGNEEERLIIETKISEVLSRLSLEPSEQLEKEFQSLIDQKRQLERKSKNNK